MIDPRKITPLLSNMSVDREIAKGPNGHVYLVTRRLDGKKLALKHISIPASDTQTNALIYSGAVKNTADAHKYFYTLVKEIKNELLLLNNIKNAPNILKFRGYQVDEKYIDAGYDVYLLSDYLPSLPKFIAKNNITQLQAINLAIDLCSALEQLRSAGLIHKDVHPNNIFLGTGKQFLLADLGVSQISELSYSSMPDNLITEYTAPEVQADSATLSETMDIYSIGMILYEIYSGFQLPLNSEGEFRRTAGQALPAPEHADIALSEIILRACAFDPDDRYQDPSDMKQALMLYMQRGNISDEPLLPMPEPEPEPEAPAAAEEDEDVNFAVIAATIEEGQAAQKASAEASESASMEETKVVPSADAVSEANEDYSAAEETAEEEMPEMEPVAPPTPKPSLNDLGEDDMLLPSSGEISIEDFIASLRTSSGLEVMAMDNQGNMSTVPGYETEETLPDDTEFVDSADNHFAVLKNMGEMPTSDVEEYEAEDAPAVAPDPELDDIMGMLVDYNEEDARIAAEEPEYTAPEAQETPEEAPVAEEPEVPVQPKKQRRKRKPEPQPESEPAEDYGIGYDSGEEDFDDDYAYEKPGSTWKKILITIIVLLVLAGGSFALYTFKTDTINSIESEVLSSTSVLVTAKSKNNSAMEVVCSTAAGETVARLGYTEAGVTFTDLSPDTTYTFTLESADSKLLLGSKTVNARTREMTSLNGFGASSVSAVSATLALSGTGQQPDSWVVTLTPKDGGEIVTATSSTIPVVVTGLAPNTTYTAEISRGDGDLLGGTTTCEFSTMDYTRLSRFETTDITTSSVSLAWEYSGTVPDKWSIRCVGSDGTDTTQDIAGTECSLDGLTSGETYTISLLCESLEPTEMSTIEVGIPAITVTSIESTANDDGDIEVSWEYTGDITPENWQVSYAYITAGGTPAATTLVSTDTNSVTISDLLPDTSYEITLVTADNLNVGGEVTTTCVSAEAEDFTDYGCNGAEITLYVQGDPDNATNSFTTQDLISFAIQVHYDASEEEKSAATTYIIRDAGGNPLYIYQSERSWPGTWTTAKHTADLPETIPTPGEYTLDVYFNGQFLASKTFTVGE